MDQGVRRCLVPWRLRCFLFFVFPVYLTETALVCLSVCFVCLFVFPGMAIKHECLRGICLWHGPWHQTSACPALPRSPRLGVVTGTFWRACLPSQVSWLTCVLPCPLLHSLLHQFEQKRISFYRGAPAMVPKAIVFFSKFISHWSLNGHLQERAVEK